MKANLVRFKFSKIFRQANPIDANRLSRIRLGTHSESDLAAISHDIRERAPEGAVVLCERKADAVRFNREALLDLHSPFLQFEEERTKNCKLPSVYAPVLDVKHGCRVILKKNGSCKVDKVDISYVNGDVCTLVGIDPKERMILRRDDGEILYVGRDKIHDTRYKKKKVKCEDGEEREEIKATNVGYVSQYPVTLGYAQTIHSSQGMTIDRVHVHLSKGRPFCPNMLYVALSRCKSIAKISLNRELLMSDVWTTMKGYEERTQQYDLF